MLNGNKTLDAKSKRGWIIAGMVGVATLGFISGAQAGEGHGKKHKGHHEYYAPGYVAVPPGHVHYYAPAPVVYVPRPVVYAPRPVVVYPAPMAYVPAYPAYPVYGPPSPPGLNLNLNVPLY
jgi:hypothetical protein